MFSDNLGRRGTAKQSSSHGGYDASKALEGNRNQNFPDGSCGHTAADQTTAWWRLDSRQQVNIYNIVIYYRNTSKYELCVLTGNAIK